MNEQQAIPSEPEFSISIKPSYDLKSSQIKNIVQNEDGQLVDAETMESVSLEDNVGMLNGQPVSIQELEMFLQNHPDIIVCRSSINPSHLVPAYKTAYITIIALKDNEPVQFETIVCFDCLESLVANETIISQVHDSEVSVVCSKCFRQFNDLYSLNQESLELIKGQLNDGYYECHGYDCADVRKEMEAHYKQQFEAMFIQEMLLGNAFADDTPMEPEQLEANLESLLDIQALMDSIEKTDE